MGGAGEAGGMSEAKVSAGTSDRPRNHIRRESPPRKRRKAELKTRIAKHMSGRVRPPDAALLSSYETITEENNVTQATGGGTQNANCEAHERTSPNSWRSHVIGPQNHILKRISAGITGTLALNQKNVRKSQPISGQNVMLSDLSRNKRFNPDESLFSQTK